MSGENYAYDYLNDPSGILIISQSSLVAWGSVNNNNNKTSLNALFHSHYQLIFSVHNVFYTRTVNSYKWLL